MVRTFSEMTISSSQNTSSTLTLQSPEPKIQNEIFIDLQKILEKRTRIKNQYIKEFIAELFGTLIMLLFGLGSVAQLKFLMIENPFTTSLISVNLSFGFGVVAAILVTGKASGCHINPSVSFAMLLTGRMSIKRFVVYVIAQFCGAFLAAAIIFLLYLDALQVYEPGMYSMDTAGIFATYPVKSLSIWGGFFDQVVCTCILVIVVLAVSDKRNVEMPHATSAILIGLTVVILGTSFAYNCGYAINPARDFGPRFFTLIAGWGSQVLTEGNYFFWIPLVAPMVGSLLATFLYLLLISNHL